MENFYIYFFILFGILSIIIIYLNNRLNKLKNILSEREKFELLLENASDGVFILDKSGKIKHFSETTSKMLGYDKNEMKLLYVYDWDKGITKKIFNELIDTENTQAQMRKGILEFCILLVISRGKVYCSDILSELRDADLLVVEGTVYPLLTRLKNSGLLSYDWEESPSGPPRKYYRLTEA